MDFFDGLGLLGLAFIGVGLTLWLGPAAAIPYGGLVFSLGLIGATL